VRGALRNGTRNLATFFDEIDIVAQKKGQIRAQHKSILRDPGHPMKLLGSSRTVAFGIVGASGVLGVTGIVGGCGSGSSAPAAGSSSGGTSSGLNSSGSGLSGPGGSSSGSTSSGASSSGSTSSGSTSSGGQSSPSSSGVGEAGEAGEGESLPVDASPATADGSACVKGQVPPSKVIVIGDSYLDHPAWSNAIPDLYTDLRNAGSLGASATFREYQLGGAAMNYGALNLNIPYQYETSALGDVAVMNPKDIDTIIMDGGGNDVLIDNQSCLNNAQPPPADTACATAIKGTLDRASMLLKEVATNGVKHIVYLFYPHLDPAGGGLLPTPAPQVNATLDYAYPLAEQICCGSSFTGTAASYTCSGNASGTQCVFIDTRPAFEGHVADYIKSDHVHPTDAGAQVIADLIAGAMRQYCIAQ
jgi:hypothetical protein